MVPSKTKIAQIYEAGATVIDGRIVFDEVVPDACPAGPRKDALPVDAALTNICHSGVFILRRLARSFPILDVDEREPPRIFQRIGVPDGSPAQIHLHFDEPGIRVSEKEVVGELATESVGRLEFKRVVMIGELRVGFLAAFAGTIEEIGRAPPTVGLFALRFIYPGADDELLAQDVGSVEGFGPFGFDDGVGNMP
jgi:hypothetical protein